MWEVAITRGNIINAISKLFITLTANSIIGGMKNLTRNAKHWFLFHDNSERILQSIHEAKHKNINKKLFLMNWPVQVAN